MEWKVTEQGPRAVIEVWCADGRDGLYKAYLTGQGQRCLLGTLIPEGKRLYLRRVLSVDSLRRQGMWPVTGVEKQKVCVFQASKLPIQWADPVLKRSAERMPDCKWRREQDGVSLYFQYDAHKPFPMTAVFCFARAENGQIIFSFREDGMPYISSVWGREYTADLQKEGKYGKSDHERTGGAGRSARV